MTHTSLLLQVHTWKAGAGAAKPRAQKRSVATDVTLMKVKSVMKERVGADVGCKAACRYTGNAGRRKQLKFNYIRFLKLMRRALTQPSADPGGH